MLLFWEEKNHVPSMYSLVYRVDVARKNGMQITDAVRPVELPVSR